MLSFMLESTEGDDKALMEYLTSDVLRLFKDSEDRAHGQADQNVNASVSHDGTAKVRAYLDSIAERCGGTGEPSGE